MNATGEHLVRGARELLVALVTPSPQGYMGVPVLVWGMPGTGKSTFISQLARADFPVVTLIASIHDPTDFSGLPMLERGRMRFAPPAWAEVFERAGQGILFLDELTTAPPAVQAALLRLVLERKLGSLELPRGVRVVAAANPPDIAAAGWELSLPLANRFVHLKWELDGNAYYRALEEGFGRVQYNLQVDQRQHEQRKQYWTAVVANFLRRNPQMAHTEPAEGEYAFASPRTWDYAIALMAACDLLGLHPDKTTSAEAEVFLNLIQGCVGKGAATAFVQHLRQMRMPDPEAVLQGKQAIPSNLREDELYTLFNTMASLLLRWQQNGHHSQLGAATLHFLNAVYPVAQGGRADSAYVAIRRIVREGLLQRVLQQASLSQRQQIAGVINQLEVHYSELVSLLER